MRGQSARRRGPGGLLSLAVLGVAAGSVGWSGVSAAAGGAPWVLLFDGDSVSQGFGVDPSQSPSAQIAPLLEGPVRILNVAVPGRPVSISVAEFPGSVAPHFDAAAADNVIAFHGGDNDIAEGRTAAEAYASLGRYIDLAHAQGWRVIVSTELGRPDFGAAGQAELAEYNRLELGNRAGADAVIDLASVPGLADLADRGRSGLYGPDHIHPSAAGYGRLAHLLRDVIAEVTSRRPGNRPG